MAMGIYAIIEIIIISYIGGAAKAYHLRMRIYMHIASLNKNRQGNHISL